MSGPTGTNGRKLASLRELPQAIEPAHDLWPGIESRLAALPPEASAAQGAKPAYRRALRLRWLAAAAMVACVAVGVWIGRSLLPGGPVGGAPPIAASRPAAIGLGPTAFDAAYVSDPRYERQRRALVRALQERLAALPPPARAKVSASLAAVEKAKKDLEQALGQDPGNALLQELLINTYQDEMRVLTDVHEASDSGREI
ncbi:MAG TPA: hypothetical protein VE819_04270 [Steroidobacteraceae bacterium]|jgi:hypothetical protein|nr:hypothetical protein [Steroidobacteraceae bacterium]